MAKFLIVPGTYAAGDSIPLINTRIHSRYVFHEDGTPTVSVKGTGCFCNTAQYAVAANAILTVTAAGQVQIAIVVDGEPITDATLATVGAAAGTEGLSATTIVSAAETEKINLRAITAVTVTGGNLLINRIA